MLEGMPITWVDIAVISVVSISGVLAYLRGFTKETLSITAWVGAVLLTYYGFDFLVPYADQFFGKGWIATLATIAGPFVFCLILLGVIAGYLAKKIKNSAAGPVDRALGFLFGVARGGLIVCLLFLGISWLWGDDPLPLAFQKARAAPLIHKVNRILISLAPQHLGGLSQVQSDSLPPPALETDKTQQSYELLAQPKPKAQKKNKEAAYTPQDRQNLDLLMEKNQ